MPDIDIDFCFERRGEVIDYVRRKYGRDAVGQIITFGTMKSRAVVRDVGRTLGFKPSETDRIAKMIPNQPGQALTIGQALERISGVKSLYEQDERHRRLFDYSRTLEGLSRHASVHAAGVVIAPGPLSDYVPVCIQPRSGARGNGGAQASAAGRGGGHRDDAASEADIVTQYDMNCVDDAGMLKMDFLGLRTLTIISDAVRMVTEKHGALRHPESGDVYPTMDDVPLDDGAVYAMLAQGGTSGVFQFESELATGKLRAMRCDRFEDLVATNALIRPGPLDSGMTDVYIRRKLGQEPVTYPHPELEELLEPTYGIIVYQEQVMRIVNILAGYSLGEADVVRKAVGKKIPELIRSELASFRERATRNGVDRSIAAELANQIETFGRYGFNRAHSAGYSLISYHTAWLKCHYPAEFMAALLSSVLSSTDQVVKYILECRELHRSMPALDEPMELLPPDVNESGWKFTVTTSTQIRFGLGAVRGVGAAAVESVLKARAEGGRFDALFDFLERIDTRALNKRACEGADRRGRARRVRAPGPAPGRSGRRLCRRERARRRSGSRPGVAVRGIGRRGWGPDAGASQRPGLVRARASGEGEGGARLLHLRPSAGPIQRRRPRLPQRQHIHAWRPPERLCRDPVRRDPGAAPDLAARRFGMGQDHHRGLPRDGAGARVPGRLGGRQGSAAAGRGGTDPGKGVRPRG